MRRFQPDAGFSQIGTAGQKKVIRSTVRGMVKEIDFGMAEIGFQGFELHVVLLQKRDRSFGRGAEMQGGVNGDILIEKVKGTFLLLLRMHNITEHKPKFMNMLVE
ncbi:hypothetical protein U27_03201 [Candidatus Vecturithrix granuli]|uniref:Uncharacterized protein n=1 Tax=Vecturithrix granuli TaxID=1499967 RepID=A0A081BV84_VECG1|nr:hypothetical protein U27_03201 [Candidatus Vecturithrix granuli]